MFLRPITLAVLLLLSSHLTSQWDSYEAVWQGQPGLMMVQMDLHDHAPYLELPHLLEISQTSLDCDPQGYPSSIFVQESEDLISNVDSSLSKRQYVENAGRLIYQCKVRDYFYVQDSAEVAQWLSNNAPSYIDYQFKLDPEWKVYMDFIYPDDYLVQTMINGRILKTLENEGFLIQDKTLLSHYATFDSVADLLDYRNFLIGLNYKIEDISESDEEEVPSMITFSRKDRLVIDKLSNTTLRLHQRALSLSGSYDGWEIVIE